jgi:hypothetical protein
MLFSSVTDEEHKTETNIAIIFSECPVFDCLVSKHYLLLIKALRKLAVHHVKGSSPSQHLQIELNLVARSMDLFRLNLFGNRICRRVCQSGGSRVFGSIYSWQHTGE